MTYNVEGNGAGTPHNMPLGASLIGFPSRASSGFHCSFGNLLSPRDPLQGALKAKLSVSPVLQALETKSAQVIQGGRTYQSLFLLHIVPQSLETFIFYVFQKVLDIYRKKKVPQFKKI